MDSVRNYDHYLPIHLFAQWVDIDTISTYVSFNLTSEGYEVVSKHSDKAYSLALPNYYLGVPLTSIPDRAFLQDDGLNSIIISSNIEKIGRHAFGLCSNLSSITFAKHGNLTYIGSAIFLECYLLSSIHFPKSIKTLDINAISFNNISSITFEQDCQLETIGMLAFGSSKITSIKIPKNVKNIGSGAFSYDSLISKIEIEEGNQYFKVIDNNLYSYDEKILYGYFNQNKEGTILNKTVKILSSSFNSSKVETLFIPSTLEEIEAEAFANNAIIKKIIFAEGSNLSKIGTRAFIRCSSLETINLPYGLTTIESSAFYQCTLKLITIPSTVTYVGNDAFGQWTGQQSVIINGERALSNMWSTGWSNLCYATIIWTGG